MGTSQALDGDRTRVRLLDVTSTSARDVLQAHRKREPAGALRRQR
jgi:hypothetical protein